jgi:hypothetical protein
MHKITMIAIAPRGSEDPRVTVQVEIDVEGSSQILNFELSARGDDGSENFVGSGADQLITAVEHAVKAALARSIASPD